ncbi:hypothetical protein BDV09DRAFT_40527 [Aspergillus tetrazonus]
MNAAIQSRTNSTAKTARSNHHSQESTGLNIGAVISYCMSGLQRRSHCRKFYPSSLLAVLLSGRMKRSRSIDSVLKRL